MASQAAPTLGSRPQIKFGTDGWRGVIADDFTFQNVRYAAQGIANYMRRKAEPKVVIGYDCRFGAERFAREVARITAAAGIKTYLTQEPSPTQVSSWTILELGASGAVVLTASHNPAEYLGIKYKPEYAGSASPEVVAGLEEEIARVIESDSVQLADFEEARQGAVIEMIDPRPAYKRQVAKMVDVEAIKGAGLRIVHDPMFGSGAGYVSDLLAGGRTTVDDVRAERNPGFGGIHPEPIPENLEPTLALMGGGNHDLCICTDGDADRVGIIDERGRFVNQLEVYALLMDYLLGVRGWKGPVVRTLTTTSMADKLAAQYGVECHEVQVGFKFVGPLMMETQAILGGEESGGFGFRGHIPERDGILAGLFIADFIIQRKQPLSALLQDIFHRVGPHAYHRRDVRLGRETYAEVKERTYQQFQEDPPKAIGDRPVVNVRADDGFKFYFEDGSWVLVRFSGTEPVLRLYAEAPIREVVDDLIRELGARVGVSD
jgi:phosphomannomutase